MSWSDLSLSAKARYNANRRERYSRDPEYRAKVLSRARVQYENNTAYRASAIARSAMRMSDPSLREKQVSYQREWARKRLSSDPEFRAKLVNRKRRLRAPQASPTRPEPVLCECCGRPQKRGGLCLDHCHVTGVFRGWLCVSCNLGIGQLGDNLDGLERALAYLKRADETPA